MAHLLDINEEGRAAFAFTGDRSQIWHGLGQQIDPARSTDIDYLIECANLGWSAVHVPLRYTWKGEERSTNDYGVIRDDTGDQLGVCDPKVRKEVQPREIVEFFRDFLAENKLSISTLGALRGGRIVFALAKLGPEYSFILPGNDKVDCYVRLQTSFDSSRSTSLAGDTVRQVCANTERLFETRTQARQYITRHSQWFDANGLQAAFGLLGEQQRITAEAYNKLAQRQVITEEITKYFCDLLNVTLADFLADTLHGRTRNKITTLLSLYSTGPGATLESASGTAFGLLNAVTRYVDHEAAVRNVHGGSKASARAASAWFGNGAKVKERARELALALAA